MVADVVTTSQARIDASGAESVEAIRALDHPVIAFSDALWADLKEIRAFLFTRMYRAPAVMRKRAEVTKVVEDLFPIYLAHPHEMSERWHADMAAAKDETAMARIVSDYIAGMTDRYALQEHARLVRQGRATNS